MQHFYILYGFIFIHAGKQKLHPTTTNIIESTIHLQILLNLLFIIVMIIFLHYYTFIITLWFYFHILNIMQETKVTPNSNQQHRNHQTPSHPFQLFCSYYYFFFFMFFLLHFCISILSL